MKKIAVIGAGVSGLACGRLLSEKFETTIFEKEKKPGGLVRCERIEGNLFHICGGHVFNTKNARVEKWFWSLFDRERDFTKADRKSAVCMDDGRFVDYPVENHVYQMDGSVQRAFLADMLEIASSAKAAPANFDEFLRGRFGRTLYDLYFRPYNAKVWRCDLRNVPLSWLDGKLPMPTVEEMLLANINHSREKSFVHSSFWYPKAGGSQFIADTLAEGLDIVFGAEIGSIEERPGGGWRICGRDFDKVVFCGNLKNLPSLLGTALDGGMAQFAERLPSHGTTAVLCETDPIPYSWFYQPSPAHQSHRFICTGNFAASNNAPGKMTCTVEFTDSIEEDEIERQLSLMPFHPKRLSSRYSRHTYPVQHADTREGVSAIKNSLERRGFHLAGRFAEWEYFNMDAAIASAMACCDRIGA
ncbi:MAG: NAD(P)-binding protein [Kiritimatiellae bacterium]|nr:NAD(P)-binding protein [Kiritimatiellia bacterium]